MNIGTVYLGDCTYTIKIFAYMVVAAGDNMIYNTLPREGNERDEYFEYVHYLYIASGLYPIYFLYIAP